MKKVLIVLMTLIMVIVMAACGGGSDDIEGGEEAEEVKAVITESGAISVMPLDIPDYITEAKEGEEGILIAKEGEGYGVGEYINISGAAKEGEDSTWQLRCSSYVPGEEYTLDMMLTDLQAADEYETFEKITLGSIEVIIEEESDGCYYYTVSNNHPIMIQIVGEDLQHDEAVADMIESLQFNY